MLRTSHICSLIQEACVLGVLFPLVMDLFLIFLPPRYPWQSWKRFSIELLVIMQSVYLSQPFLCVIICLLHSDAWPNVSMFMIFFCSARAGTKRRGGPGGLNKVCGVSPELQAIVGQPALPRTEVQIRKRYILNNCLPVLYHFLILLASNFQYVWFRLWNSSGHT